MRVKPLSSLIALTGIGVTAYAFKEKLLSFLPSFSEQNNQNQAPIPIKSLALTSLTKFAAPKLDISNDRRDLSTKNLSLKDLQQLDIEVEKDPFVGHVIWGTLPPGQIAHTLRKQIEQKIIKNNQTYQRYPSDFIHALFSAHAYQALDAIDIPVIFEKDKEKYKKYQPYLDQWRVNSVHDLPQYGGYYAASYYNKEARQLVLAHRGTPFELSSFLSSLNKDDSPYKTNIIGVLIGDIVAQQAGAYITTKAVAEHARDNHYHFSMTGHSLGAWLAEFSAYYSVFEFGIPAKTVTFDSPGSIDMKKLNPNIVSPENNREIENLDITTYLSAPNFVNTCHEHVGKVYRIYPEYKKDWMVRKGLNHPGLWSLGGHFLELIILTFDPISGKPKRFDQMKRWPQTSYTHREQIGSNTVTQFHDTLDTTIDLLNLDIKSFIFKKATQLLAKTTAKSLIHFLVDVESGRFDQKQYDRCWQLLTNPLSTNADQIEIDINEFAFKYEGGYEVLKHNPYKDKLFSIKGSPDWALEELHNLPLDIITQEFGEENLITQQLFALRKKYTISVDHNDKCSYLTTTDEITVEALRKNVVRLLDEHLTQGTIKKFLETHQQKIGLQKTKLNLASTLTSSLGRQYIYRPDDFKQIDEILAHHSYAIICGESGFGKTTLAREYGHRQENKPLNNQTVFTIDADSPQKIATHYHNIATRLGIFDLGGNAELIRTRVYDKFKSCDENILLIFDNVEKAEDITHITSQSLPKNIKVLITKKHSSLLKGQTSIKLRPFNYREAEKYIKNSAIRGKIKEGEVEALIAHYAKDTEYVNPRRLEKAIALIEELKTEGITGYLETVRSSPDGEMILQRNLLIRSKYAWLILQYASYLDPDVIDLTIFEQLFGVKRSLLKEALTLLDSLSLTSLNEAEDAISLHRLTQGEVRAFVINPLYRLLCLPQSKIKSQLGQSLNALFPNITRTPNKDWLNARQLMPHVALFLNANYQTEDTITADLLYKIGKSAAWILGSVETAYSYHKEALRIRENVYHNIANDKLVDSCIAVGMSHIHLGGANHIQEGINLLNKASTIQERLSLTSPPNYNTALLPYCLGFAYEHLPETENKLKAIIYHENALRIVKNSPATPKIFIAMVLHRLGTIHVELGSIDKLEKGLKYLEDSLEMQRSMLPSHPDTASYLGTLGLARIISGLNKPDPDKRKQDIELGFTHLKEAVDMGEKIYDEFPHPMMTRIFEKIDSASTKLEQIANDQERETFLKLASNIIQTSKTGKQNK